MTATAILSPHPDDAVLSCWQALTSDEDVMVVNVFAGIPDDGAPVAWWDRLTGASDPVKRMHERLDEDQRALALAGRAPINLEFLDDQYRAHEPSIDDIVEKARRMLAPGTKLLAPVGIGGHPDHLLVRAAALRLLEAGFSVALYAELPHAIQRGWPRAIHRASGGGVFRAVDVAWEQALARLDHLDAAACIRELSARQRRSKIEAVRTYQTQLEALNAMAYRPLEELGTLRYEVLWTLADRREMPPAVNAAAISSV